MIKVYKASNYLTVPVVVDGKIVCYADFCDERNTYRTSNEVHQKALESLPIYGKLFKIEEVIGKTEKPKKKKTEAYPEVTDWQDASALLVEKYGADKDGLDTPDSILAAAKKAGVSFPGLE